ncbi:hypothetical protein AB7B51_17520 [Acinetobacter baumannii]|uniref:hypothetical protein n=1 Tax=Acinetobacter baumannii TaxID=470 RepID=UPI0034E1C832
MNNATITKLYRLNRIIRRVLKINAWIHGIYAGLISLMVVLAGKSIWSNSHLLFGAVAAIAAYLLVPRLIDWAIERAVIASARKEMKRHMPGLKPLATNPKIFRLF